MNLRLPLLAGTSAVVLLVASLAHAQTSRHDALANAPFKGDFPTAETAELLNDGLYFQRAVQVYLWSLPAVNMSVVLVDRREPGSETSYGNTGILSSGSIFPINQPSLWKSLPKYLTNRHAALRWNTGWAIGNAGWLIRFLANARPDNTKARALALRGLIRASLKLHREWIVKADAAERIRETGWLKVWRSDAVAIAKAEQAKLAEYGIESTLLDRHAISALEPNILPVYKVGLLHTQTASVNSPGAVVKAYARMRASHRYFDFPVFPSPFPSFSSASRTSANSLRSALSTLGKCRSRVSSAATMLEPITTRANHLWSAGTTIHGAALVEVCRIRSW